MFFVEVVIRIEAKTNFAVVLIWRGADFLSSLHHRTTLKTKTITLSQNFEKLILWKDTEQVSATWLLMTSLTFSIFLITKTRDTPRFLATTQFFLMIAKQGAIIAGPLPRSARRC